MSELKEIKENKEFRIQNRFLMLTYKSHLNKEEYINWITKAISKTYTIDFIRLAHEKGDTTHDYEHTHVVIEFNKNFQTKDCRYFDYKDIHPHIQVMKTRTHLQNAKRYLAKEDHSNDDLAETIENVCEKIWSEPTIGDALKNHVKTMSDVSGIVNLYKFKQGDEEMTEREKKYWSEWKPRSWQQAVINTLIEEADDRKIFWIYDEIGNTGKSKLIQYIKMIEGKKLLDISSVGKVSDVLHCIRNGIDAGWTGNYFFVDLARAYEDRDSIYEVLEHVKNGSITTTKYDGKTIKIPGGGFTHVFVTANFLPNIYKMSLDRWVILELTQDYSLNPLTLDGVKDKTIKRKSNNYDWNK